MHRYQVVTKVDVSLVKAFEVPDHLRYRGAPVLRQELKVTVRWTRFADDFKIKKTKIQRSATSGDVIDIPPIDVFRAAAGLSIAAGCANQVPDLREYLELAEQETLRPNQHADRHAGKIVCEMSLSNHYASDGRDRKITIKPPRFARCRIPSSQRCELIMIYRGYPIIQQFSEKCIGRENAVDTKKITSLRYSFSIESG